MHKILIIEDDDAISNLMKSALTKEGYTCETAPDGLTGEQMFDSKSWDLVLLDLMLPGISGFELIDYIKPSKTPVIIISAMNQTGDKIRGLKMGADDYIGKPFQIGDFIEGAGYSGTVEDITILYTHIITPDNLKVSLPNGKLSDDAVINYTALGKRRADISVSVPYECDLKTVRAILLKVAEENPYRLKDDPITVEIRDYADSGIKMCVRYYANNDVFWTAVFKTRQDILDIFKEDCVGEICLIDFHACVFFCKLWN